MGRPPSVSFQREDDKGRDYMSFCGKFVGVKRDGVETLTVRNGRDDAFSWEFEWVSLCEGF